MKLLPYINFDGTCVDAIKFYEKVFNVKAEFCTYEDILKFDNSMQVPEGKEKWVMHGSMKIADGAEIQLADCDDCGKSIGKNICLQLTYKTADEVKTIYNALKVGGKILCEIGATFYAPLYSELIDKFGIRWSIMQENPQ